jgi:hypothetical protein
MWRFFLFIAYSTLRKHKNHIVASNIFQSCSLYMVAWKQPVCEWLSITSRPLSLAMIHHLGIPTPESCWNRATCKSIPGFRLNLTILKGCYLPCFLHHGVPHAFGAGSTIWTEYFDTPRQSRCLPLL